MVKPQMQKKINTVEKIKELSKKYKTIVISSVQSLPAAPFERLRKKLRGKAEFLVTKNVLVERAFEKSIPKEFVSLINGPSAMIFTDLSPSEIYKMIEDGKSKAFAKPGQVAPFDIIIPAGETTLPPGPVLSELKMVGIDARLDKGKVVIGKDCKITKKGEKIKKEVANALIKLNIMPMEIKMVVIGAFDKNDKLLYSPDVLCITSDVILSELKKISQESLNVAMNTNYPTPQTMMYIIPTAVMNAKNLAINANVISEETMPSIIQKAHAHANALSKSVPQ